MRNSVFVYCLHTALVFCIVRAPLHRTGLLLLDAIAWLDYGHDYGRSGQNTNRSIRAQVHNIQKQNSERNHVNQISTFFSFCHCSRNFRTCEIAVSSRWLAHLSVEKVKKKINQFAFGKNCERQQFSVCQYEVWTSISLFERRCPREWQKKALQINSDCERDGKHFSNRKFTVLIAPDAFDVSHGNCHSIKMINECHRQIYAFSFCLNSVHAHQSAWATAWKCTPVFVC